LELEEKSVLDGIFSLLGGHAVIIKSSHKSVVEELGAFLEKGR